MKGIWRTSAVEQPMNGQPVWVYHQLFGQIHQAVYEWVEFGEHPFRWRTSNTGAFFLGHSLWQPRLSGEMPDPPPAEKPK